MKRFPHFCITSPSRLTCLTIGAVVLSGLTLGLAVHPSWADPDFSAQEEVQVAQNREAVDGDFTPDRPGPGDRDGATPPWLNQLNLTPDQLQRIQAIHNQYRPQLQTNRQAVYTTHQEMRELMSSDTPSNTLRQKHQQLQALHQESGNLRFESMLAIREVLTPSQRQQASTLMEQHRGHMDHGPEGMGPEHMGPGMRGGRGGEAGQNWR